MIFKIWFIFGVACAAALCRSKDASRGHFKHSKYKSLVALAYLCNFIHTILTSFLLFCPFPSQSAREEIPVPYWHYFCSEMTARKHTVCAIYYWRVSEIKTVFTCSYETFPSTQVPPTQICPMHASPANANLQINIWSTNQYRIIYLCIPTLS